MSKSPDRSRAKHGDKKTTLGTIKGRSLSREPRIKSRAVPLVSDLVPSRPNPSPGLRDSLFIKPYR